MAKSFADTKAADVGSYPDTEWVNLKELVDVPFVVYGITKTVAKTGMNKGGDKYIMRIRFADQPTDVHFATSSEYEATFPQLEELMLDEDLKEGIEITVATYTTSRGKTAYKLGAAGELQLAPQSVDSVRVPWEAATNGFPF